MRDDRGLRVHGDVDAEALARRGLTREDVLDFSVNVSPLGPHPAVVDAARAAALDRYPETTGRRAREALAGALDVDPERIVLGHGAAELLWTAVRAFADPVRPTLVAGPTFSEARAAVEQLGRPLVAHDVDVMAGEARGPAALIERVLEHDAALAYLCNPNNPTGELLRADDVATIARATPRTRWLLDEAFLSLSDSPGDARVSLPANVVRIRSMTKDHALPGLRPAYALASPDDAHALETGRPAWSTSAPLQAAVEACVAHPEHVAIARSIVLPWRIRLADRLARAGLRVFPSATLFVLVEVPVGADAVRDQLLRHGVIVRSCASFGLPRCIRLCARPDGDVDRLLAALAAEGVIASGLAHGRTAPHEPDDAPLPDRSPG